MNQSEFKENTCNRRQARENACDKGSGLGWEKDASFANQSQSAVKQHQRKLKITFDTQMKITVA